MFSFVAISATYVFGTLLTANGDLKKLNIIAGIGVIISLSINLLLVPRIQAVGSAYASLSAQFITAIAQVMLAIKIFRFTVNYKYLAVLVTFTMGMILMGYFSKRLPFEWKMNFAILIGVSILFTFILRLINLKEFFNILRTERT
jgi:O-antigen/teichoic acid export membrane protein